MDREVFALMFWEPKERSRKDKLFFFFQNISVRHFQKKTFQISSKISILYFLVLLFFSYFIMNHKLYNLVQNYLSKNLRLFYASYFTLTWKS